MLRSRQRHPALERRLRDLQAPQEIQAQERAWAVARTAYAGRTPSRRRRARTPLVLVPAILLASVLALTPAGATVHRWIARTFTVTHPRPELFSLPALGRILVSGPGGTWTVAADGTRHRLGAFPTAAWSPRGLYVAVAGRDGLTAITPNGTPVWTVARPDVRAPRWYAPNGYRIAYLSGATLRVIAGDGTQDRLLARGVADVAPSWQSGHPYRVAYVRTPARLVVQNADSGRVAWTRRLDAVPELLAWSADGTRLLVLGSRVAVVFDAAGHALARVRAPASRWRSGALSPDGSRLALVDDHAVSLVGVRAAPERPRTVFTLPGTRQVVFSPDATWILASWPAADQWVFIHAVGTPRITAASAIARQFAGFPTLEGWCCTSNGGAG